MILYLSLIFQIYKPLVAIKHRETKTRLILPLSSQFLVEERSHLILHIFLQP
uniref:Uncharacterized protein n=1 Tax=Rhizophora mucronata TaxID=61149 RepID=A0A2P2N5K8_RHIMU